MATIKVCLAKPGMTIRLGNAAWYVGAPGNRGEQSLFMVEGSRILLCPPRALPTPDQEVEVLSP